jgi:hypothetical protein
MVAAKHPWRERKPIRRDNLDLSLVWHPPLGGGGEVHCLYRPKKKKKKDKETIQSR